MARGASVPPMPPSVAPVSAAPTAPGRLRHMLPRLIATRYVLPLREGGSMPGLMETSDDGMNVVKFRGAGQGVKTLVAEVLVGGIARAIGVAVPDLSVVDVPGAIARYEADEEVQDLLDASLGLNLGMDFLPAAFNYDGTVTPTAEEAARIIWLDAYTVNIDRTWSNPNLIVWHGRVYAIDHGAALYFHHSWPNKQPNADRFVAMPFDASRHVLCDVVPDHAAVAALHEEMAARLTDHVIDEVVSAVPEDWLEPAAGIEDREAVRDTYRAFLQARRDAPAAWLPGVTR